MKLSDADILIIPGHEGLQGADWQSRWLKNLPSAQLIEPMALDETGLTQWAARIIAASEAAAKPVVLVAHGSGITAVLHAAPKLPPHKIAGAFLVAAHDHEPPVTHKDKVYTNGVDRDRDDPNTEPAIDDGAKDGGSKSQHKLPSGRLPLGKLPLGKLPFAAMLIASGNCPNCELGRAKEFADAWGATLVEAGDVGGLNAASGHGPWPEGLMRFGAFLKTLG